MITVVKSKEESKFQPVKLLPHQKHLLQNISHVKFPIYVCWSMGSGKTIGACMCMSIISSRSKLLPEGSQIVDLGVGKSFIEKYKKKYKIK